MDLHPVLMNLNNYYYSTDGGYNWDYSELGVSNTPNSISLPDPYYGWIAGYPSTIIHIVKDSTYVGYDESPMVNHHGFNNAKAFPNPCKNRINFEYTLQNLQKRFHHAANGRHRFHGS